MTCELCGARCHGRLCAQCEQFERFDDDVTGGETTEEDTDLLPYVCCDCGGEYQAEHAGQCPHCGNWGARYDGPLGGNT